MNLPIVIIGAGGHAKTVFDILSDRKFTLKGFIDPNINDFFSLEKIPDNIRNFNAISLVMGLGGTTPSTLSKRLDLYHSYKRNGAKFINLVSSHAFISSLTEKGSGIFINNGAIINGPCEIGDLAIINTRAVIEHDVMIKAGSHIAPGAIILGGCHIGKNCMIGAGAIILPETKIPDNSLIPALTRYPK